jgi:tripartite-type tricarboxylate transporter receptor subunit TctC
MVARFNAAMRATLADEGVRKHLSSHGVEPTPSSPEELTAFMKAQTEKWRDLIRSANITQD